MSYDSIRSTSVGSAFLASLLSASVAAQVVLSDQTTNAGLIAHHDAVADAIPGTHEGSIGGLAVGDFNNDGFQDLFWTSGGYEPDKLFINNGDGTFTEEAAAWGATSVHVGNGVAVADYDNDGYHDIYITSFGPPDAIDGDPGYNMLYRNDGDGALTDMAAAAGVNYTSQSVASGNSAAFGDYDLDGDLDLLIAAWQPSPDGRNKLYRNDGDGTFTDVTVEAVGAAFDSARGWTPMFADMNCDLYPEILFTADFGTSRYLINNGDGTFTDFTEESGTGLETGGMGHAIGDIDNDGLFEWYVTSIFFDRPPKGFNNGNFLYDNLGDHSYADITDDAGPRDGGFGWGAVMLDLDQDGYLDIVEVNGAGAPEHTDELAYLYYNNGDGTFTSIAEAAGLLSNYRGRSLAYLDVENDGDLDLVIGNNDGPLELYRNDTPNPGSWLRISFDTSTNDLLPPDGFNAHVIATVGADSYHRYQNGSPSYLATSEFQAHFGLGDAVAVDELRVIWSRGYETVLHDVAVNQHLTIVAPSPGDLDADGLIGTPDLLILLGQWGEVTGPAGLAADLDNDGVVGSSDLVTLLGGWG